VGFMRVFIEHDGRLGWMCDERGLSWFLGKGVCH
jgi:hypothetical protein